MRSFQFSETSNVMLKTTFLHNLPSFKLICRVCVSVWHGMEFGGGGGGSVPKKNFDKFPYSRTKARKIYP